MGPTDDTPALTVLLVHPDGAASERLETEFSTALEAGVVRVRGPDEALERLDEYGWDAIVTAQEFTSGGAGTVRAGAPADAGAESPRAETEPPDAGAEPPERSRIDTGIEFARRLAEHRPETPVILAPESGDEALAAAAVEAGVDAYVPGGSDAVSDLVDAVRRVADGERPARIRREWETVDSIHDLTLTFEDCETPEEVYRRGLTVIDDILEFEAAVVFVRIEGLLVPQETRGPRGDAFGVFETDEGIVGRTYQAGEPHLVDRVGESELARPAHETFEAGISVPAGPDAVIQIISTTPGAYDAQDVTLVELVASHVAAAVTSIESRAEVEREHERFLSLFENVPDAVAITDNTEAEIVQRVNPAFEEVFGYPADDIVGEPINDWIVPPDAEPIHPEDVDAGADVYVDEIVRQTAEGPREFLFRGFGINLEDAGYHYGIYTDITERKERERELAERTAELERQNRRLDRFAGTLSHDLRNPITLAQGQLVSLESALADEHVDATVERAIDDLEWAIDRMDQLIDEMLVLARTGQSLTETEPVAVEVVARNAARSIGVPRGVLEVEGELPTVEGDPGRLTTMFENLFRNALEHAAGETVEASESEGDEPSGPDGGEPAGGDLELTIRLSEIGDGGFAVEDDGPGIPADERDDIFESGYTTADEGTGFGLAIVGEVVEAHGWSIEATDGPLGGARFEIRT